jgi:hypothetical protein
LTVEKEQLERKIEKADSTISELAKRNETTIADLAKRIEKMETVHKMGAGIAIVIPIIGAAITLFLAKGAAFFKPWLSNGSN